MHVIKSNCVNTIKAGNDRNLKQDFTEKIVL